MSFPHTVYLSEDQIRTTSSTQNLPLGTRGVTSDGRVYRYAQAGATDLKENYLTMSANVNAYNWSTATSHSFATSYAAGATAVRINDSCTNLGADTNYYKDGYMIVPSTDTAYYQIVRIYGHRALTSHTGGTTGELINLETPGLSKAVVTSTSLVKLIANPYKLVVASAGGAGIPNIPTGIPAVAVTAKYFFWCQTWGPALCRVGSTVTTLNANQFCVQIGMDTAATGGITPYASTANVYTDTATAVIMGASVVPGIGYSLLTLPAANFFQPIFLTLHG